METVEGLRADSKLYVDDDGYLYYLKKKKPGSVVVHYSCQNRQCNANISVYHNEIPRARGQHNHEPDKLTLEICRFKTILRTRAASENKSLREIFAEAQEHYPNAAVSVGGYNSMKSMMKRSRRAGIPDNVPQFCTIYVEEVEDPSEMEERDRKLISLVKQYPYLYDRGDTNFKNKALIEKSWRIIASHMRTSAEDCQRRWGVLRNKYAKEKRESNILDPTRREWSLLKLFDFLDVHVKTRKTFKASSAQNGIYLEDHPAAKVGKWEEIIIDEVKLDHSSPEKICHNYAYSEQTNSSSLRDDDEANIYEPAIVMPQLEPVLETRNPDSSGNSYCEIVNNKNVALEPGPISEDSNMHFCLSLQEPLSKIPAKFLTKVKIEILQVLDKYEHA